VVALNFQMPFSGKVEAGIKRRTIRLDGKRRPPRAGETLQLYFGMRTRYCRLLRTAKCTDVRRCILNVGNASVWRVTLYRLEDGKPVSEKHVTARRSLDAFAHLDGFNGWPELVAYFAPRADPFGLVAGYLIEWGAS